MYGYDNRLTEHIAFTTTIKDSFDIQNVSHIVGRSSYDYSFKSENTDHRF